VLAGDAADPDLGHPTGAERAEQLVTPEAQATPRLAAPARGR
jgi:hypothetical protein